MTATLAALAAGVVITVTYGLVLAAMAFSRNVSYVVAFRQVSIPIGVAMGVALLKEPLHPPKALGVAVLLVGLGLVALN